MLAACSGGADPSPAPVAVTTTITETGTPTPSASAVPVLPDAAKQPTRPGAEAFFRYFMAVYSSSLRTLDPAPVESLSEATCTACKNVLETMADARTKGDRFSGGAIQVVMAVAAPDDPSRGLLVQAIIDQTTLTRLNSKGVEQASSPSLSGQRVDAALRWTGAAWKVLELQYVKPGA